MDIVNILKLTKINKLKKNHHIHVFFFHVSHMALCSVFASKRLTYLCYGVSSLEILSTEYAQRKFARHNVRDVFDAGGTA